MQGKLLKNKNKSFGDQSVKLKMFSMVQTLIAKVFTWKISMRPLEYQGGIPKTKVQQFVLWTNEGRGRANSFPAKVFFSEATQNHFSILKVKKFAKSPFQSRKNAFRMQAFQVPKSIFSLCLVWFRHIYSQQIALLCLLYLSVDK